MVGEYYTCSSVSVDSVIVYLRQIASLAGCWLPVVHSVIMVRICLLLETVFVFIASSW